MGDDGNAVEKAQYRAPALEKGLDIIQLLATDGEPLTATEIVQRLGRSTGELFRMIQVLERRGFVQQGSDGYTLTTKMFEMGIKGPPVRNLVEIALPAMRSLARRTGQSCHLAFRSLGDMVIVARMESQEQLGFTLRVGYRLPLYAATSGATLYAFQPDEIRAEWEASMQPRPSKEELAQFRKRSDGIRAAGFATSPSRFVNGITDISAPIMRGERAAAALAVPYVSYAKARMDEEAVIEAVCATAAGIAAELVLGDDRA